LTIAASFFGLTVRTVEKCRNIYGFCLPRGAGETHPDARLAPAPPFRLVFHPPGRLLPLLLAAADDGKDEGEGVLELPGRLEAPVMLLPGPDVRVEEEPADTESLAHRRDAIRCVGGAADVDQYAFPFREHRNLPPIRIPTFRILYLIIEAK